MALIVLPAPACVTLTLCVRTPLAKAPETAGVMVPAVVLKSTALVKLGTVLLFKSCALMMMLKGTPATCGLLIDAKEK